MALKNLLVACNGGEASDTAFHLGALMSQKYGAHLTGIVAHGVFNAVKNFPAWLAQQISASLDDMIAHAGGRPILVATKRFRPVEINQGSVIAWDGKRRASRALFDAMQILETKKKVTLLTVGERGQTRGTRGINLPTLPSRHGIEADHVIVPKTAGGTAGTLLDFCMEQHTGLLVMGAFEHTKLTEDLFGGVTTHILREAEGPVFLAH